MKKLLRKKERGSAIPLAVVAVLILLAMGTGLLSMGFNSRTFATRSTSIYFKGCCHVDWCNTATGSSNFLRKAYDRFNNPWETVLRLQSSAGLDE